MKSEMVVVRLEWDERRKAGSEGARENFEQKG